MAKKKTGVVDISIIITREDEHFCSWNPEFDIASCGCTREDAINSLREAVDLYLSTLAEEEELEHVLDCKGIRVLNDETEAPASFVTQFRQALPESSE